MPINHSEILRGILIGSGIFLCSIMFIITIYLLYRYRKDSFYFHQPTNADYKEEFRINDFNIHRIKKPDDEIIDPLISLNNDRILNNIAASPTIIEDLMRKSLELAKTAEKVADEKEKKISPKDRIQIDLEL